MGETAGRVAPAMPVIVVGADTPAGMAILSTLAEPGREVRAFVSDERVAAELRGRSVKVALGDVSDESHVEAASMRCFTAIMIAEAADDRRERSFAATPHQVLMGWGRAITAAGVRRAIWVMGDNPPDSGVAEVAVVEPDHPELGRRVAALDDAQTL
jgi:putative NADH-flavin reductase